MSRLLYVLALFVHPLLEEWILYFIIFFFNKESFRHQFFDGTIDGAGWDRLVFIGLSSFAQDSYDFLVRIV